MCLRHFSSCFFLISCDFSEVNELFLAEVSCHPFRSAPGVKFGMSKMGAATGVEGTPFQMAERKWLENGGWSCTIYLPTWDDPPRSRVFFRFPKKQAGVLKNDSQNKSQLAISFARSKWGHFQGEMARYGCHRHRATKVPRLEFLWEMQRERFDTLRVERKSEKEIEQHPI